MKRSIPMLALLITLLPTASYAAGIMNGVRGPKPCQADARGSYAENRKPVYSFTGKCWNNSVWVLGGVKSDGTYSLGAGPRREIDLPNGKFHLLSHASLAGGKDTGNLKVGIFGTYLSETKRFEIDVSGGYSTDGTYNAGLLVGGRTSEKTRTAGGIDIANGVVSPQFSFRKFLKRKGDHLELSLRETPKGINATLIGRINF